MPSFNLVHDPWIPVVTRSRQRRWIRPSELTIDAADDPVTDIVWPRADFRGASLEFLIGLLATACPPEDDDDWKLRWDQPPSPTDLSARFDPFASAFSLDGSGPRFLQDRGDLGNEVSPIAGLLIDQPGSNTEKNNADLFVKRGQVQVLGRRTAAMALYALQAFAPAGGAGHRTSLRGGGPLTSLALPGQDDTVHATLWHKLWLNVTRLHDALEHGEPLETPEAAFPWLGDTRLSDKSGVVTTGSDMHPVQCFWGMPRRINLVFEDNVDGLPCDITGEVEPVIVRNYRTRPYGVNYAAVRHPLTPYYRVKPGDVELLPVHPQPGGIAYRQWLGYVQEGPRASPASCVVAAKRRLQGSKRLSLFGYDMDNMKARGFVETEMPFLVASSDRKRDKLAILAARMVDGATEVASLLIGQIKAAYQGNVSGLDLIRETFFKQTESAFFGRLSAGLEAIEATSDDEEHPELLVDLGKLWLERTLAPKALDVFDAHVDAKAVVMIADIKAFQHIADARRIVAAALSGHGPSGRNIVKAVTGAEPPKQAKKAKREAQNE
ncbi:type I-E CRISPR-associated protein Cse1/CasA [Oryzibacter oryziterrae]|uniref:type I-E CRISPR-associated protein Cse1/CasA n=1 Tax=Oryzibacter oryziterrae TaxID=2766474 RepID=UPI001F02558A|nr:type I-E CRISPR-associated protein Cse1/CasA [Oryzibacter oryziterrae]